MTEYARLVLSVDSASGLKAASDLDRLEAASRKAEGGFDQLERQTKRNAIATGHLKTAVAALGTTLAAAVSVTALRSAAGLVQTYQEMAERVQMATSSQAEFELVQRRLLATANGTYRSLSEAQELYIRTADSLRSMGYSTQQALDVTDSMSYAFVTNATSAERAEAAISAFAKSMNTGKVAADQWETITTALPSVINDIADATGRSAAEIRAMGAAGKLSARDLSEGLRKSLEDNSKAAANMATNLRDAGVRAETAITAILVAVEKQSGAIQSVTDTIIDASNAVLEFGEDAEAMESMLHVLEGAALAVGSVIAGRLITAMAAYSVSQGQAIAATLSRLQAEQLALSAAARRAAVEKQAALNAVAVAKAEFEAAKGTNAHALAANNLIAAQARAGQAASANAAAQHALNGAMTAGRVAANGLRTAMAFLGGPLGVVLLAATAVYAFSSAAKEAKQPTIDLAASIKDLSGAQRELAAIEATRKIQELSEKARQLNGDYEAMAELIDRGMVKSTQRLAEGQAGLRVEFEQVNEEIDAYKKRLVELGNFKPVPASVAGDVPEPDTSVDGQKSIARMREQLELAKLQGEARVRLAAIQALGAEATEKERQEAGQLAAEIYRLEDAQKAAARASDAAASASKKASDEARRQADEKRQYVSQLERHVDLLGKTAVEVRRYELAERELTGALLERAEASLDAVDAAERQGAYRALLLELRTEEEQLTDQMRERLAVLDAISGLSDKERGEAAGRIASKATEEAPDFEGLAPEVGGAFGELAKIDEAEDELREWYETQLEMLEEFRQDRADLAGTWDAEELVLREEHERKLQQLESARYTAQLSAAESVFGDLAGITRQFAGEQSDIYKAMFVASKAFAIADGMIQIANGVAKAANNPWPINLGAMASVAAAGVGVIASIQSVGMVGMAHDGIDSVPREGTWLLDKGERVVDQRTNGDLKKFLSQQSQPASGGPVSITINQPGVTNARDARESAGAVSRRVTRAVQNAGRYG